MSTRLIILRGSLLLYFSCSLFDLSPRLRGGRIDLTTGTALNRGIPALRGGLLPRTLDINLLSGIPALRGAYCSGLFSILAGDLPPPVRGGHYGFQT